MSREADEARFGFLLPSADHSRSRQNAASVTVPRRCDDYRERTAAPGGLLLLPVSDTVLIILRAIDTKHLQEAAFSRLGDDHRAAVLHPLGPAEIEIPPCERGPDCSRDVWASFGPIETQPAEVAAG